MIRQNILFFGFLL